MRHGNCLREALRSDRFLGSSGRCSNQDRPAGSVRGKVFSMVITYRRTGGPVHAAHARRAALAATVLTVAVAGILLIVAPSVAAVALLGRAVLPRRWRHRTIPAQTRWPQETIDATVVTRPAAGAPQRSRSADTGHRRSTVPASPPIGSRNVPTGFHGWPRRHDRDFRRHEAGRQPSQITGRPRPVPARSERARSRRHVRQRDLDRRILQSSNGDRRW